jgi:hypothetical protein
LGGGAGTADCVLEGIVSTQRVAISYAVKGTIGDAIAPANDNRGKNTIGESKAWRKVAFLRLVDTSSGDALHLDIGVG